MKRLKRWISLLLAAMLITCAALAGAENADTAEDALNLKNNPDQAWTYQADADAWVLSVTPYVAQPVLAEYQSLSVCVPGAYVLGLDTEGDGAADVTAANASGETKGSLVLNPEGSVTSPYGQVYTAATAPVLFETGGAGYSAQRSSAASTNYAANGFIYMTAGNRGKQSSYTDENGQTVYTGDAPDMIVDGKAAIRFVRHNIALGNLPGSAELLVVTGGSGAGAHTMMIASTGDNPVYYDYLYALGAAGLTRDANGAYTSTVSDAVWGALGYSPITSLAEADMAMAFEYTLDAGYSFSTAFQKQLAAVLSEQYMEEINSRDLSVEEAKVGFDLDGDGALSSTVALTIERDEAAYPETNGYHGTYLDLYLAEFTQSLQSYLDRLDYAEGWTWFNTDGTAMTDEQVAAMTAADRAEAFLQGRVNTGSSSRGGRMGGGMGRGMRGQRPEGMPEGGFPGGGMPGGNFPAGDMGGAPQGGGVTDSAGNAVEVGTPDQGTTQAAGSATDSSNYATYDAMVAAYEADIAEVLAGDAYGNNTVSLYDPLQWIADKDTTLPTWVRMMNGAREGDIAMFNSLNIELAMLNAGVDAEVEWQWNGGHVPGEVLGDSLALRIDSMVGKYVEGAVQVEKPAATSQTANGTAESANGTDVSSWVTLDENGQAHFTLADIAAYRTAGASKAMPAFDVLDYGQEDYVFGSDTQDARHWDTHVLQALTENRDTLESLFNAE